MLENAHLIDVKKVNCPEQLQYLVLGDRIRFFHTENQCLYHTDELIGVFYSISSLNKFELVAAPIDATGASMLFSEPIDSITYRNGSIVFSDESNAHRLPLDEYSTISYDCALARAGLL